jgi:tetratricopeptide (TPR) repeat protein
MAILRKQEGGIMRGIGRLAGLLCVTGFVGQVALAQPAPSTRGAADFPLAGNARSLDQATIDETVAAAKAVDIGATTSYALLSRGLTLFQEEKYPESIPFLEEALRLDPSLKPGWEALGWAYRRTGEEEKAHRLWEYFLQLMPDDWMPYNLLAQEAILNQDWILADKHFKKALQIKPDLFDLRFWYAQNLLRLGKPPEAENVFRQLIKEEPGRLDIHVNLANLLIYKLEYDEAVEIYRHVNLELPDNVPFMLSQASLELKVGEMKAADQMCLDVLGIETNNVTALSLRADIAEIADMTEMSVERLQKLIDATDDPVARGQVRVRLALRCSALNERKAGLFPDGLILDELSLAIMDNPDDVMAQVFYAERCLQAKKYGECRKWAVNVLEKFNRHSVRAKNALFELALAERKFDEADQILHDRFSNYDATDPMRFYYESRLLAARGSYNEALKMVDRMEAAAKQGTVLTLLYHDLTESDWMPVTSVRRLREHLYALKQEGFTFISPTDIPSKVGLQLGMSREDPPPEEPSVPWTALLVDNVRYGLTGEKKFKSGPVKKERVRPMKVAAITFDGALRSSLLLGSSVAEEIGTPFGMFVSTKPSADYMPSIAGWDEICEAVANGTWIVGSQLHNSMFDKPVDAEGKVLRRSLPNRLWLPEKNRLESMNEWDKRMRSEFRDSRKALREHLGDTDSPVAMMAYPYGDLGQERTCNLSLLRNPIQSIVSEASRSYQLGFVQSASGYTTVGDNLLLSRRFEPNWYDEGSDVVRKAYETHPLFMARRTRVEIAFLMNKPHLAAEMLDLLKRDGYPDELCRRITEQVRSHFRNRPARSLRPIVASSSVAVESAAGGGQTSPAYDVQTMQASRNAGGYSFDAAGGDGTSQQRTDGERSDLTNTAYASTYQAGEDNPWMRLNNPNFGGEVSHAKANDQFEILRYGLRGGVGLNKNLKLSVEYFQSDIEQRIRPLWNRIRENDRVVWVDNDGNRAITTDKAGFDAKFNDPDFRIESRTVPTESFVFKALRRDLRGRLTYRTPGGALVSAGLGQVDLDLERSGMNPPETLFENFSEGDGDKTMVGDLSANWFPRDDLNLYVFYARDLVTSAVKKVESDSAGALARWKPTDQWDVLTRGVYWSYDDNNALFYLQAEAFKEMDAEMGIWLGFDLSTTTASKPSDFYWAPYWDQRAMAVLRYLQAWHGYNFRLDLLAGFHREKPRPISRVEDAGISGGSDWSPAWGLSSSYNKQVTRNLDLFVDANVTALQAYIDHRFLIGFNLGF